MAGKGSLRKERNESMRFSVIVPVYNSVPFLMRSVESVVKQTFTDWELILVDDGSTDGSGEVIRRLAEQEPRIRWFHQENRGQFFARRRGIDNAEGEYLLFLDSDDAFTNDCLEKVNMALRRQPADIVVFAGSVMENGQDTGRCIGKIASADNSDRISINWLKEKLISSHDLNSLCLKAFRRNMFKGDYSDYSAFKGTCCGEDKVQLLYPLTRAESVIYIPECLYRYYYRENSTMRKFAISTIPRMIADEMYSMLYRYMQEWGLDGPEYQELVAVYYLRNYLSVYFGLRKRCTTLRERWRFRHYPWRTSISREAIRYRFSDKLTTMEKLKLLVAALRI